MTPKEIIEVLQEHFEDRMEEEISIEDFGGAFYVEEPEDKQNLKECLEFWGV